PALRDALPICSVARPGGRGRWRRKAESPLSGGLPAKRKTGADHSGIDRRANEFGLGTVECGTCCTERRRRYDKFHERSWPSDPIPFGQVGFEQRISGQVRGRTGDVWTGKA